MEQGRGDRRDRRGDSRRRAGNPGQAVSGLPAPPSVPRLAGCSGHVVDLCEVSHQGLALCLRPGGASSSHRGPARLPSSERVMGRVTTARDRAPLPELPRGLGNPSEVTRSPSSMSGGTEPVPSPQHAARAVCQMLDFMGWASPWLYKLPCAPLALCLGGSRLAPSQHQPRERSCGMGRHEH